MTTKVMNVKEDSGAAPRRERRGILDASDVLEGQLPVVRLPECAPLRNCAEHRPPGHVTLVAAGEVEGVLVPARWLIQHCTVVSIALDAAIVRDADGAATVEIDDAELQNICGGDHCGVPVEAPIFVVQCFVAWLAHHAEEPPSLALPETPLPSVEYASELFDDLWDYSLMRLISPELRDPSAPWRDITLRPIRVLWAADLAATVGCRSFLGIILHYFQYYARKEVRCYDSDVTALAALWARRAAAQGDVDPASPGNSISQETVAAARAWLDRTLARRP